MTYDTLLDGFVVFFCTIRSACSLRWRHSQTYFKKWWMLSMSNMKNTQSPQLGRNGQFHLQLRNDYICVVDFPSSRSAVLDTFRCGSSKLGYWSLTMTYEWWFLRSQRRAKALLTVTNDRAERPLALRATNFIWRRMSRNSNFSCKRLKSIEQTIPWKGIN